jgi:hypothetical protein
MNFFGKGKYEGDYLEGWYVAFNLGTMDRADLSTKMAWFMREVSKKVSFMEKEL